MSTLQVVLLAAGSASRFGGAKQAARVEGVSLVRRAALAALELGAGVIVVTGAHAAAVDAELAGLALTRIHNPAWEDGMGGSIACGFRELLAAAPAADGAIVCLADQPRVGAAQLRRLVEVHGRAAQAIACADHGGDVRGPPVLFPRDLFAELAALRNPRGARVVLERHAARVQAVPMAEAAIDIDTVADLQRLLAMRHEDLP